MRTFYLLAIWLLIAVNLRDGSAAPAESHTIKKRVNNLPVIPAGDDDVAALTQLKAKRWKLVPIKVEQVESYENKEANKENEKDESKEQQKRSSGSNMHTFREFSSTHQEYSNNNGDVKTNRQDNQQVSQDGQVVSAFRHRDEALAQPGDAPHFKSMTEVDVPWLNIHDKVTNEDGHESVVRTDSDIQKKREDTEQTIRSLVEYIEETGDDATVASFLESFVKEGKMSEAEALVYVEGIESMLEKDRQIEEMLSTKISEVEKEEQREDEAELILNLSDFLDLKYKSGKINKQAYDDLKGRLMETVVDIARDDPYFLSQPNNNHLDEAAGQTFF